MTDELLDWNPNKNKQLKQERGLCFEEVEYAIEQGDVLDDFPHPDQQRYSHQRVLVVNVKGYACIVPYVTDGETRFLKTMYRSRKAQKIYLRTEDDT